MPFLITIHQMTLHYGYCTSQCTKTIFFRSHISLKVNERPISEMTKRKCILKRSSSLTLLRGFPLKMGVKCFVDNLDFSCFQKKITHVQYFFAALLFTRSSNFSGRLEDAISLIRRAAASELKCFPHPSNEILVDKDFFAAAH